MLCNYAMPLSWESQNVLQKWVRAKLLNDLHTAVGSPICGTMWQTDYFFCDSVVKMKKKKKVPEGSFVSTKD